MGFHVCVEVCLCGIYGDEGIEHVEEVGGYGEGEEGDVVGEAGWQVGRDEGEFVFTYDGGGDEGGGRVFGEVVVEGGAAREFVEHGEGVLFGGVGGYAAPVVGLMWFGFVYSCVLQYAQEFFCAALFFREECSCHGSAILV